MLLRIFSSYTLFYLLLIVIAISCGIATFIENDFGTISARALVYEAHWFEAMLALSMFNLSLLIYTKKMYQNYAKFFIHFSLIVIFASSFITRYFGYEGTVYITEKSYTQSAISSKNYLQIWLESGNEEKYISIPYEMYPFAPILDEEFELGNESLHVKIKTKDFQKLGFETKGKIVLSVETKNAKDSFEMDFIQNQIGKSFSKLLDSIKIKVQYGSIQIPLPFEITLDDFVLKKYPGTNYPSEYLSYVMIHDATSKNKFAKIISMNQPLSYKGYKLFQTSYSPDEKGTILSLNKDPGKIPTYMGYSLLILGLVLSFFSKNSRLYLLIQRTKRYNLALLVTLCFAFSPSYAQSTYLQKYLQEHQQNSKELSEAFGALNVQAMGRMQPLGTLSRDILYKFSRKSTLHGMDANQILLGMLSKAELWKDVPLFSIKTDALKKLLGKDLDTKLISFNDLFGKDKEYLLIKPLEEASLLKPSEQSVFHKEVIRMNERVEISHMIYGAKIFSIFPDTKNQTDVWRDFQALWQDIDEPLSKQIQLETLKFLDASFNRNYEKALTHLKSIETFQKEYGKGLILEDKKLHFELFFNKLELFEKLTFASIVLGILSLVFAFGKVFYPFFSKPYFVFISSFGVGFLFVFHFLGLLSRWYISGHAPMSDTYESMLYIAFSALFFALFFFRNSLFASSASILLYAMFMLGAYLSHIDPQITTLVPVLKSFWLTLHVSVIAGSYGFLGVAAMISLLCLVLYALREEKRLSLDTHINYLSNISEIAIYIGLVLLLIGNLLGAIWANESWGRYWGWDPKETWTFISIIFYTLLVHMKYLQLENFRYWFNVASLGGFGAILMTYFGVNYYLAGMHSYATGDPVPIPLWVYLSVGGYVLLLLVSSLKRKNLIER